MAWASASWCLWCKILPVLRHVFMVPSEIRTNVEALKKIYINLIFLLNCNPARTIYSVHEKKGEKPGHSR